MAVVRIVEPDGSWAAEFRQLARRLRTALGDLALRIDHIGSTSVPGLAAKDILDIQVTVKELDAELLAPAFERAGFSLVPEGNQDHRPPGAVGPDTEWRKLYFGPQGGRPIHVHTRADGRANQRYALLFRDYLRAHPPAAAAYAELKRRLAALGIDSLVYADVKDPACDLIVQAAEAWAHSCHWQPGKSDA
jgi:GrpB-like predicted nucleotidyltransferase (UPF0157 family)